MNEIFGKIVQSGKTVFSMKVLANFFGESDMGLLRSRLSHYSKKGYLKRITRGIYTVNGMKANIKELANTIYSPSYISFETALYHHGMIFQVSPNQIDLAYKKSDISYIKSIDLHIRLRALKEDILLSTEGIEHKDNYSIATAERAFLDMIYIHKEYYFDNLDSLRMNKIKEIMSIYKRDTMMLNRIQSYFPNF